MGKFAIHADAREDGVILKLVGELTVHDSEPLKQQLFAALEHRPKRVVIDASALTFISSLGLGSLVEVRRALEADSVTLRLAGASDFVAEIFRKTRLAEIFPMYSDPEQALTEASGA
ncbi:MAG: STAS domain-containing protein [Phycisphaeraceae bacterium]